MNFMSLSYLWFLAILGSVYYFVPPRHRTKLLLVASLFFGAVWSVPLTFCLLLGVLADYAIAKKMIAHSEIKTRLFWFRLSLVLNLGLFFYYKYLIPTWESVRPLLKLWQISEPSPLLAIAAPVGIAYFMLQKIGLLYEVYKGKHQTTLTLESFILFCFFFPTSVVGPIQRSYDLLPQLQTSMAFDEEKVVRGLRMILGGLFKKWVIADWLATLVDPVYATPEKYQGLPLLVATYAFAFELLFDFGAVTDIARGSALCFGYETLPNFNRPYLSRTVVEYWKRWHISLSSWFRDYCYFPLGGNRVSKTRLLFNIFVVFTLSGLWHGAKSTFIIWGALHAFYVMFGILTAPIRQKISDRFYFEEYPKFNEARKIFITFHLLLFGRIFFRAESLESAWYIITHSFNGVPAQLLQISESVFGVLEMNRLMVGQVIFAGILAALIAAIHSLIKKPTLWEALPSWPTHWRWVTYYAVFLGLLFFARTDARNFIYFQF